MSAHNTVSICIAAARRDDRVYITAVVAMFTWPRFHGSMQDREVSAQLHSHGVHLHGVRLQDDRSHSITSRVMFTWLRSHGGKHNREVGTKSHAHGVRLHSGGTILLTVHITLRLEPCSRGSAFTAVHTTVKFAHSHIRTAFTCTEAAR